MLSVQGLYCSQTEAGADLVGALVQLRAGWAFPSFLVVSGPSHVDTLHELVWAAPNVSTLRQPGCLHSGSRLPELIFLPFMT